MWGGRGCLDARLYLHTHATIQGKSAPVFDRGAGSVGLSGADELVVSCGVRSCALAWVRKARCRDMCGSCAEPPSSEQEKQGPHAQTSCLKDL